MNADKFIIYTDMDGTVLSDWDLGPYVPQRSLEMLRDFRNKGGLFSVASGRDALSILKYFPEGLISAPLVCSNGALVYDSGEDKAVYEDNIPKSYCEEAMEYCRRHRDVSLVTCDKNGLYHVRTDERELAVDGLLRRSISSAELLQGKYLKLCYILKDASYMQTLMDDSAAFESGNLVSTCGSGPNFLEAVPKDVSKAQGIKKALEYAKAQNRVLVCIGDYYNDLEMLQEADIAACPSNSPRDLKEICRFHCCSNNEGAVGDLIEKLYEL